MFAPRYFGVRNFASRYFAPGLLSDLTQSARGGGSSAAVRRRRKKKQWAATDPTFEADLRNVVERVFAAEDTQEKLQKLKVRKLARDVRAEIADLEYAAKLSHIEMMIRDIEQKTLIAAKDAKRRKQDEEAIIALLLAD